MMRIKIALARHRPQKSPRPNMCLPIMAAPDWAWPATVSRPGASMVFQAFDDFDAMLKARP